MKIFETLPPFLSTKMALSIGMFDGLHLGHQYLLKELTQYPLSGVLTFKDHPAKLLYPEKAPFPLLTLQEKCKGLENLGVDVLILLEFTSELAHTAYDQFLYTLAPLCSHLIQGEGDAFGKERLGTSERVIPLAETLGMTARYLPKLMFEGEIISSRRIRTLLSQGQKEAAHKLLRTPFPIFSDLLR